jgi:hypothetical protein
VGTCGRTHLCAAAWSLGLRTGLATTNGKGSNYVDFHLMLSGAHLEQYNFCSANLMLFRHLYKKFSKSFLTFSCSNFAAKANSSQVETVAMSQTSYLAFSHVQAKNYYLNY